MILKQGFNITGDLGSGFSEDHLFRPSPDYAGPNTMSSTGSRDIDNSFAALANLMNGYGISFDYNLSITKSIMIPTE
ncbi:uncharacterized protein RAG0_12373 [Rhynchosporium agropyri]|uniref:Uncharacterized protein n=1 Tax=Rhynchosporium agropyri TaxID=914238 RepID=A0A1E1L833_9HELO|nr:uncharacterized protein RAG0_12373 [Rhynchosporium agropyri]